MEKEIKNAEGKVVGKMIRESNSDPWKKVVQETTPAQIKENVQLLTEAEQTYSQSVKRDDIIRSIAGARYFNYASLHEYENDEYSSNGRTVIESPDVVIDGTILTAKGDDKAITFDFDEADEVSINGWNCSAGVDENGNRLAELNVRGEKVDNGKRKVFRLEFVYPVPS